MPTHVHRPQGEGPPVFPPQKAISAVLIAPDYNGYWDHKLMQHSLRSPKAKTAPAHRDDFVGWARTYPPFVEYFSNAEKFLPTGSLPTDDHHLRALSLNLDPTALEWGFRPGNTQRLATLNVSAMTRASPKPRVRDLKPPPPPTLRDLVKTFEQEALKKFGMEAVCGGAPSGRGECGMEELVRSSYLVEVTGPFEVHEYDGHEEVYEMKDRRVVKV